MTAKKKKHLYNLVVNLRTSYKEILILYYYCDFTIKEISKTIGLTEGAAKTLLFRARKKLKTALEGKNEAIEEYLSERIDMDLFNLTTSSESEQHNEETIKIKKSVNSRLRKVVFTSVSIVIALVIGVFFIISPLVGSYYYNPAKITLGEGKSDINFDLYAITELNFPGYSLSSDVHVEKLGFGEYDINFYFTDIQYPVRNSKHINEQKQRVTNHIMKLNPVSYVSANLTFEKDLTMEELYQLEQKYPAFHIMEWLVSPTGYKSSEMSLVAKAYELHYKSVLKYMIDRNEATKVLELDFSNRKLEYYKSALDYAEEHGVKTFGVLIYSNAEDIIELVENEPIKLVEINQVLASRGYIQ